MQMLFGVGFRLLDWETHFISLIPKWALFNFQCPCIQMSLLHESCVEQFGLTAADFTTWPV